MLLRINIFYQIKSAIFTSKFEVHVHSFEIFLVSNKLIFSHSENKKKQYRQEWSSQDMVEEKLTSLSEGGKYRCTMVDTVWVQIFYEICVTV